MTKTKYVVTNPMQKEIFRIATKYLGVDTLESRHSDSLDFYDCAVWKIEEALEAAYLSGFKEGKKQAKV